jgi:hypothetical protein
MIVWRLPELRPRLTGGRRDLLTREERGELKKLRKEKCRADAILKDASVYFAQEFDLTQRG